MKTEIDKDNIMQGIKKYIGRELELKEMPQLRSGNPNVLNCVLMQFKHLLRTNF
jgi:hypothetical protein